MILIIKNNLILLLLLSYIAIAQAPDVEWFKAQGTNTEEHVHEGFQTSDGGYIGIGHGIETSGSDDMLIIKGVNVYPEAIKTAILKFRPQVTGLFRIMLKQPGPVVKPPLKIKLEYGTDLSEKDIPAVEEKIMPHFKEHLRIGPQFQWVPPGTIPREMKKTKFIEIES